VGLAVTDVLRKGAHEHYRVFHPRRRILREVGVIGVRCIAGQHNSGETNDRARVAIRRPAPSATQVLATLIIAGALLALPMIAKPTPHRH